MKYLEIYKSRIEDGTDKVGKWMSLLLEFVERGLDKGDFFYNEKKADLAINFIERFCRHFEGSTSLIVLEPWQKFYLACVFGLVGADNLRQFREIVLIIARKQGKSLIAAAIQVYVFFCDDEAGMQIYNVAPKLKQAEIIFNGAYRMIENCKTLSKRVKKRKSDLYQPRTNGSMMPLAFSSKKSDGLNPHMVTFDEFAVFDGVTGLKMADVMLSAVGARKQPLFLYTSTANYVDDGLYDNIMLRSTSVLLGTSKEKRLLPFIFMIDDEEKWDDIEELRKAMPNLGVSVQRSFIEDEIIKARESLSYRSEFKVKYCNLKQNAVSAWLSSKVITDSAGDKFSIEDFSHCYAVGGVDLSRTTDLTSATIVIKKGGKDYVINHSWMPANKVKEMEELDHIPYSLFIQKGFLSTSGENFIKYRDVVDWFVNIRKKYKMYVLVVGYDRYSAQDFVDEMEKANFPMDDVIQGTNLTPVIREFEGLVKDGTVRTGVNGLLQLHLANTALKKVDTDGHDNRVKIAKVDRQTHIDCVAATLDAYTVRQKYWNKYAYRLKN